MHVDGQEGGGEVDIDSAGSVALNGKITGHGEVIGEGARVVIEADDAVSLNSDIRVNGRTGGGEITVEGDSIALAPNAALQAMGLDSGLPDFPESFGGTIDMAATGDISLAGDMNVSGDDGGGDVTLEGDNIALAGFTRADATNAGDGGNVTAIGATLVSLTGDISARGGPVSGDGGTVTFSQPNTVAPGSTVDVSAPNGDDGDFNQ
jgi:hypothetical protein